MNLYDFYKEAIKLNESIKTFESEFLKLEEIISSSQSFIEEISIFVLKNNITGGDTQAYNASREVTGYVNSYHNKIRTELRSIDFTDSIYEISNLNRDYKLINIDKFVEKYLLMCKKINMFLRNIEDKSKANTYSETIKIISESIDSYKRMQSDIDTVFRISSTLNVVGDDNSLKIQLLKEDNSIEQLINNMTTITSIYNIINSLIGNEDEKLEFRRIESGTFSLDMLGCLKTLSVLGPAFAFTYKVYSDQFSPAAKLNIKLKELEIKEKELEIKNKELESISKEIKTRGEYARLIKEFDPENKINFSDPNVQKKLLDLDYNLKKFYSDNPYININDKEYGVPALKDNIIKINFLESRNSDIEE